MVYITSRRHLEREDPNTEIKVYSNCNEVELTVNDNLIGKMTKEDLCIFRWSKYELSEGENRIEVVGILKDKKTTDSCVWKLILG
jgi:beta-galactosidase